VTRGRLWLLGLVAVLFLLLLPSAPTDAAGPAVGLNINGGAGAQNDPQLDRLNHKWQRYFVFWSDAEPQPGQLNPEIVAAYRRIAANDGRKALFVLTGTPRWANGGASLFTPPTDRRSSARSPGASRGRWPPRRRLPDLERARHAVGPA
jgi:hypothetical protein